MTEPLQLQLPRKAVLNARNIAFEHRMFPVRNSGQRLPFPEACEKDAYRVLFALELIDSESHDWSTRGRKVLGLSHAGFNAVFEHYLEKLLPKKPDNSGQRYWSANGSSASSGMTVGAQLNLQW